MTRQNSPNADLVGRETSSGYAVVADGLTAIMGGVSHQGNAVYEPGDSANETVPRTARYVMADSRTFASTLTLPAEALNDSQVITVLDQGRNANSKTITVNTEFGGQIEDSASDTITTAGAAKTYVSNGTQWNVIEP